MMAGGVAGGTATADGVNAAMLFSLIMSVIMLAMAVLLVHDR